jgi:hypothetical protein
MGRHTSCCALTALSECGEVRPSLNSCWLSSQEFGGLSVWQGSAHPRHGAHVHGRQRSRCVCSVCDHLLRYHLPLSGLPTYHRVGVVGGTSHAVRCSPSTNTRGTRGVGKNVRGWYVSGGVASAAPATTARSCLCLTWRHTGIGRGQSSTSSTTLLLASDHAWLNNMLFYGRGEHCAQSDRGHSPRPPNFATLLLMGQ